MNKQDTNYKFFKQEIETEEVEVMSAAELENPAANKSGSLSLDYHLVTPFPEGRIVEIFGPEGSCKTTLALEVAGQAIANGKVAMYVNMEKNLNLSLMMTIRSLRPFLEKAISNMQAGKKDANDCPLWIVRATTGEQAFEAIRKFSSMVPNGIAILDSIDAAQPEAVLAEEIGENKMGNLGKLLSDAMRKLINVTEKNKVTVILINQVRDKMSPYGDPKETSGGRAVKFYSSQRIELMKPGKAQIIADDSGERIGVIVRYKIVKNKLAPDGVEGEFPILLKNGIFREKEIISQCLNFGVLKFGGRGGQQVLLPVLDRKTGSVVMKQKEQEPETVAMKQFDAARRLLLDKMLYNYLQGELEKICSPGSLDAVDQMLAQDEV